MSILAGCGKKTQDVTKEEEEVEVEKTESTGPKVFRSTTTAAKTFNPHTNDSAETGVLIGYIQGTLLKLIYDEETENIKFAGFHAEDVPTTSDNIVWTFKLRDDIKWTDGTPIDANTYEYSYKMLLDHKLANRNAMSLFDTLPVLNANKYFKGEVEWEEVGIKVLDAKTLEITLETAMPEVDVLVSLTSYTTGPVHKELYEAGMNDDRTETTYATTLETVPSCGAYRLTEWVRDQHRVFEKNQDGVFANIYTPDRIESRVVTESSTRLQLFENGEIESVSVSGENFDKYAEDPRLVYSEADTVWGFFVNSASEKNPILQNEDFRKALFYGIDRDKISKGVFKTFKSAPYFISTICMVGDYKDGQKYRDTSEAKAAVPEGSGYDPELAKEYFDKAYAANGNKKIEIDIIYFDTSESFKRSAEIAEEEYEGLFGADRIDVKLRAMPGAAAYDAYRDGDYDLGIGAYTQNEFNPWSSMKVYAQDFPNRSVRFNNDEFDELYRRTTKGDLLLDSEKKLEALATMEKMLADYVPMIPLFQNDNAVLFQDRIRLLTGGQYLPGVGFAQLQAEIVD
jgi:ABC-type oligopeptide transport system substrate-binding subunit